MKQLKKKIDYLRRETIRLNIEARIPDMTEYVIQTILSRGDESVSKVFDEKDLRGLSKFLKEQPLDDVLPWDFIDHGYSRNALAKEYEKGIGL